MDSSREESFFGWLFAKMNGRGSPTNRGSPTFFFTSEQSYIDRCTGARPFRILKGKFPFVQPDFCSLLLLLFPFFLLLWIIREVRVVIPVQTENNRTFCSWQVFLTRLHRNLEENRPLSTPHLRISSEETSSNYCRISVIKNSEEFYLK